MVSYPCYRWEDCKYIIEEIADLPRPAKTLGRKLCGHDSTTPPLDFRSCSESPV